MRKFYILIKKLATVSPNLSYSHYVELLPYDDLNKIRYYIKIISEQNLSVRQLRERLKSDEYSKNKNRVITYFENGKLLDEAGSIYGKNIIKQYSEKLMVEVGKKYNERTLYRMRKF